MPRNTDWTYAEINTLKNMLAGGSSFTQIGHALGRTRCMVSGKVHRLKLTYIGRGMHDPQAVAKKARDERVAQLFNEGISEVEIATTVGIDRETVHRSLVRSGNKQKRVPGAKKERPPRERRRSIIVVEEEYHGPLIALFDLQPRHCRWPIGNPGDEGFGFCGANNIEGSSYCMRHSHMAYREPFNFTEEHRHRIALLGRRQRVRRDWVPFGCSPH